MMNETASAGSPALLSTGDYRDAMARHGAPPSTSSPRMARAGRRVSPLSAVCNVTDTPPMLLVCLNAGSPPAYPAFARNSAVCVNTLSSNHEDLSRIFWRKTRTPMPSTFRRSVMASMPAGRSAPILDDAAVSFDCVVRSVNAVGTHDVFTCEVLDRRLRARPPRASMFLLLPPASTRFRIRSREGLGESAGSPKRSAQMIDAPPSSAFFSTWRAGRARRIAEHLQPFGIECGTVRGIAQPEMHLDDVPSVVKPASPRSGARSRTHRHIVRRRSRNRRRWRIWAGDYARHQHGADAQACGTGFLCWNPSI